MLSPSTLPAYEAAPLEQESWVEQPLCEMAHLSGPQAPEMTQVPPMSAQPPCAFPPDEVPPDGFSSSPEPVDGLPSNDAQANSEKDRHQTRDFIPFPPGKMLARERRQRERRGATDDGRSATAGALAEAPGAPSLL